MLLLAITLIIPPLSGGVECPNVKNPGFDAAARDAVVRKHNELRSTLAFGTAVYKGGARLRAGKNIYQLKWDCDLEQRAQAWADRKVFQHSPQSYREAGENLFAGSTTGNIGNAERNGIKATQAWWNELTRYNVSTNPSNIFGYDVLNVAGHWSQQAWGSTRQIGCGISFWKVGDWSKTMVVCHYLPQGNWMGARIFDWGDGCSKASDCTTFSNSKCNVTSKLCI